MQKNLKSCRKNKENSKFCRKQKNLKFNLKRKRILNFVKKIKQKRKKLQLITRDASLIVDYSNFIQNKNIDIYFLV